MDDREGCGPPDRHMPSSVTIATCMVNTLVTFQANKFQSHISPHGFRFSLFNKKKNQRLRTDNKSDSGMNRTDLKTMLSNNCDKRSRGNQHKGAHYKIIGQKGLKESTWKNIHIKIHTYPLLPTNECLSPIYESPECQTDIYSGWGNWERVFSRDLFLCWIVFVFEHCSLFCLCWAEHNFYIFILVSTNLKLLLYFNY